MLCHPCKQHFALSEPRQVAELLSNKQVASDSAQSEGLNKSLQLKLKDDFQRYTKDVESMRAGHAGGDSSLAPCPWDPDDETEFNFRVGSSVSVWSNILHEGTRIPWRRWSEVKDSARTSGCRMCRILNAMIEYVSVQAGPGIAELSFISSNIFMDRGTCRPTMMRFDVFEEPHGSRSALLLFHISTAKSTVWMDGSAKVESSQSQ